MIKRFFALGIVLGLTAATFVAEGQQPPPLPGTKAAASPQAPLRVTGVTIQPGQPMLVPGPIQPPVKPRPHRPRGARPSPRHKIFHAPQHQRSGITLPALYTVVPPQLSFWGNDVDGDCVSAACTFRIAASSVAAGLPEIFIPSANVVSWATQYGYLNGANLTDVMDTLAVNGMADGNGKTWTDGPYSAVDYTTYATTCDAIYTVGPVLMGVASAQFDNFPDVGSVNGWVMTGLQPDQSEDHCIVLAGFGTAQALCATYNVSLPAGLAPNTPCYEAFTWDTTGIIDATSLMNVGAEGWVSNPTTVGVPLPSPGPSPTPVPPPPNPPAADFSGVITVTAGSISAVTPTAPPTPPVPTWSGSITISNGLITGVTAAGHK